MAIEIRLNGEIREIPEPLSVAELLERFDLPVDRVAVERNRSIVPRSDWARVAVEGGDAIEVVQFVGGGSEVGDPFLIAGRSFYSRLIVGTGKYPSHRAMAEAHRRSRTEIVTVAIRRVDLSPSRGRVSARFHRYVAHHDPAEHCGLLYGRRGCPHRAPRPRGRPVELGPSWK